MTDEEINVAITEAINADPHWKCAKDYCKDLNAMHEAEKALHDPSARRDYSSILGCLVKGYICLDAIYATARQRAEAFLKTIGKWKETE